MTVESLSSDSQAVIRRVLAFISGTRLLDGEFETRLGVDRAHIAEALMRWPAVDDRADSSPGARAINNALNEVLNGMDLSEEDWLGLGATRSQAELAYAEWITSRERESARRQ